MMTIPDHTRRTVGQCIEDARSVVHFMLVDLSRTTAESRLTTDDMPTAELAEIWQELVAMDDAMAVRDIAILARRLRRRGIEPGRELRCITATDTAIPKVHFAWCCDEIRRHREQAEEYRRALRTIDRLRV